MDSRDDVEALIKRSQQLADDRAPREALWREAERWVDPDQQGGFFVRSPGGQRDAHILENTAQMGLEAFVAAMEGMLMPEGEAVTYIQTTDSALNDVPAVQRWLAHAGDRLHACRNAPHTGHASESSLRWRALGVYGTQGFWTDEWVGRGLIYKSLHLSEIYADEDFRGRIDTVHRRFTRTARQIQQMFHDDVLPPKAVQALTDNKPSAEFKLIHVLRPNSQWEPGRIDVGRFPIQSMYICEDDKCEITRGGYNTMPISISRYILSPHDIYGHSPATKTIGTIKQLNSMARDLMRATHLNLNPPILYPSDGSLTRMSMTPGSPIPGGMENGRRQMEPFLTGVNVSFTQETFAAYQEVVKSAFLMHVFAIMNEPIDRQTATEYLGRKREAMLLQAPNAGRQIAEALVPQVERELDILLRAGQIDPPPPEFHEARAGLKFEFDNPLTRAAKSADAHNFATTLQALEPLLQFDPSALDVLDMDAAPRGLALSLGVRADWLCDPEAVAQKRASRAQAQAAQQAAQVAPDATQAMLNMAKARNLAPAAGSV